MTHPTPIPSTDSEPIASPVPKPKIAPGDRFGRLTCIAQIGTTKYNHAIWQCRCDCGGEKITTGNTLRKGDARSCGCLRKEMIAAANVAGRPRCEPHSKPPKKTPRKPLPIRHYRPADRRASK